MTLLLNIAKRLALEKFNSNKGEVEGTIRKIQSDC